MTNSMNIVILGDICPTQVNEQILRDKQQSDLISDLDFTFLDMDYTIANLECPLTTVQNPILKSGPALKAHPETIIGIERLGVNVAAVANNHIRDYGDDGVVQTLETCRKRGILTVGAGVNQQEAQQPLILEKNDIKVGIIACAENEFSIADSGKAGANGYDPLTLFEQIESIQRLVDYLIVLHHGGLEHYPYPSPQLQKTCRKMVKSGANIVICQHSHCIGSYENHEGAFILYGQGNFLFDEPVYSQKNPAWNEGLVITLNISKEKQDMQLAPIQVENHQLKNPSENKKTAILTALEQRSRNILQSGFIQSQWEILCENRKQFYLGLLVSHGSLFYSLNKLTRGLLFRVLYKNRDIAATTNIIRCESHRELLLSILHKHLDQ